MLLSKFTLSVKTASYFYHIMFMPVTCCMTYQRAENRSPGIKIEVEPLGQEYVLEYFDLQS